MSYSTQSCVLPYTRKFCIFSQKFCLAMHFQIEAAGLDLQQYNCVFSIIVILDDFFFRLDLLRKVQHFYFSGWRPQWGQDAVLVILPLLQKATHATPLGVKVQLTNKFLFLKQFCRSIGVSILHWLASSTCCQLLIAVYHPACQGNLIYSTNVINDSY